MNVWSEKNHVVNGLVPVADRWNTNPQTIVNMKSYKRCVFLVMTGASVDNINIVTIQAGISVGSCATEIVFKYRKIITGDTMTVLTDAVAGTGVAFTVTSANQYIIVEVDAQVVAAAGTDYCCVCCTVTEAGSATAAPGCVIPILSEPRYAQALLETAIL